MRLADLPPFDQAGDLSPAAGEASAIRADDAVEDAPMTLQQSRQTGHRRTRPDSHGWYRCTKRCPAPIQPAAVVNGMESCGGSAEDG